MKRLKSNRGAITILVLVTVLFFIAFLISLYIIISNKVQTQKEFISQTRKIYKSDKTMEEIYNSYFSSDEVIPIYTAQQFRKIIDSENNPLKVEDAIEKVIVNEENGKIYEYSAKSVYVLKNDIYLSEEWFIDKLINGVILQTNGYKIIADGIEYPYTWIKDDIELILEEDIEGALNNENLLEIAKLIKNNPNKTKQEVYDLYFTNDITPIYTSEQLLLAGSNKYLKISQEDNKICRYSETGNYVLKDNIILNKEWYSNELPENITLQANGYKIIADGIEYPYTWIEDNFKQREILAQDNTLSEEILIKIANAKHDSGLPLECFTVGKEFINSTSYDYVMYLYGKVYHETYVKDENGIGDGVASYNARGEKMNLLNTLCDRYAFGRYK